MNKFFEKVEENVEGLVLLLVLVTLVSVMKILVALRLATEKDNKKLLLEFIISVGLGLIGGTVAHVLTEKQGWTLGVACVMTWLGSKFDAYYYKVIDIGITAAKNKVDKNGDNNSVA